MALPVARHRFTADEYEQMGAAGILSEDARVELIEGEIVDMSPIDSRHVHSVNESTWLLTRQIGDTARVSVQNPIRLSIDGEPQPDITVLRLRDDYARSLPTAADVLLLIEIANTSLTYDRDVKVPLYARAGILEVWLVNLTGDEVIRYTEPRDGAYRRVERMRRGEQLTAVMLPGLAIAVDAILG